MDLSSYRLVAALGVSSALVGCGGEPPAPAVPPMGIVSGPPPEAPMARAPEAAPRPDIRSDSRSPVPAPAALRAAAFEVGQIRGRTSDRIGKMLEPTQERVAACVPGRSGVVRIRVENKNGRTEFSIDPDVELDPTARRCILEALSTLQLDSDDPSKRLGTPGFTSHIVISW